MAIVTKSHLSKDTIAALQELIRINIDSQDGFRYASEQIEDLSLQQTFLRLADERQANAQELAAYVEWNGSDARTEGSYAAAVHRSWLSIRQLLSSDDVYAVLAEAESGEDQIKHAYEDALRGTAGSAMNDVLMTQFSKVKAGHDYIRELRDMRKDAV